MILRKTKKFVLEIFLPILLGLRMKDHNLYRDFIEGRGRSVLSDLFSNIDISDNYYLNWLKDIEKDKNSGKNNFEWLIGKVLESYEALFSMNYESHYNKNIGEMTFTKETKGYLLKTLGGFERFADFSWN